MALMNNLKKLFKPGSNGSRPDDESSSQQSSYGSTRPSSSSHSSEDLQNEPGKQRKFSIGAPNRLYPDLPSRYQLGEVLGEGAFSIAYEATDTKNNTQVAVKIINKESLTTKQFANVKNEINLMKRAGDHPNVLKLLDYYDKKQHCFLVLELCDGGEIFTKIIEYTYFSEDLSRHVFTQLLDAIDYLHNKKLIVHRDIKPENLLIKKIPYFDRSESEFQAAKRASDDSSKADEGKFVPGVGGGTVGIIKLADFGLAKQLRSESNIDTNLKTPCGTAGYTAPEVITCGDVTPRSERGHRKFNSKRSRKNYYSKAVDIWSLGCFLYTVLSGFPPFYDEDHDKLTDKILKGEFVFLKPWWDDISEEAKDLIVRMLDTNPETRITIDEISNHAWVKNDGTLTSDEKVNNSDNYFRIPKDNLDAFEFDKNEAEHIEYSENFLKTPQIKDAQSPLKSPRANAIKVAFNNRAMAESTNAPTSITFVENINEVSSAEDDSDSQIKTTKELPRTPNPTQHDLNKVNFKDVFRNQTSIESGSETEDDVASLADDRRDSQKSLFLDPCNPTPDTRSSSIISGIASDFKFNLNIDDSSLLSRRRSSTMKSSIGLHPEASHAPPAMNAGV